MLAVVRCDAKRHGSRRHATTVDDLLIESVRSFEDPRLGIRERFLTPVVGGARTVAVLSTPIGGTASVGWVLCPSFAAEQTYLVPFEVALARGMAAAGFAVLRYHGQGYGDSELASASVSLGSHVRDVIEASSVLREVAPDLGAVGLAGARFGASAAALAAQDATADLMVLIDPVLVGAPYVNRVLGRSAVAGLGNQVKRDPNARAPHTSSEDGEMVEVDGMEIRREVLDEIAALDLTQGVIAPPRSSLIVQVSRTRDVRKAIGALRGHLLGQGGRCDLEVVVDPSALSFGLPRFRRVGGAHKVDVQAALSRTLVSRTVSWCARVSAELTEGSV